MRLLLLAGVLTVLMGCSNLVPTSLPALRGLSPLDTDPSGFVIRIELPEGVDLVHGSAQLTLSAEQADTGQSLSGTFILAQNRVDEQMFFRVADQDLPALRDLQGQIQSWETEDPETTTGNFSVSLTACSLDGAPKKDATVSVALKVRQDQPFIPLLTKAPLNTVLAHVGVGDLPPCS